MMRYLTHHFAHGETLQRARRWLVHAGFDPGQIEAVTDGIPRIAVRVNPGESSAAGQILSAVELTDPDGLPSFWELARQSHVHADFGFEAATAVAQPIESRTFVLGYRVPDERSDLVTSSAAAAMREAYMDRWDS
ncbi:MAG: hypothetical protein ACP5XB_10570 [Isosphaeraceae bacterium]